MKKDPRQSSQPGGSSVGTRAQGGGNNDPVSLRWVIMALLSAYLLAMAMTLFEIDAFQTLVAQLGTSRLDLGAAAGNSRQREILQAVRASRPLLGQSERPLDQRIQAQHELVASKLDALRVATTALSDIGKYATIQVRTDDTYLRAQREEYQEISERVRDAVTDLRKGYLSGSVCPKISKERARTDSSNSKPAEGGEAATDSAEDCDTLAKSEAIFSTLQDGINTLEGLVPKNEAPPPKDGEQNADEAAAAAKKALDDAKNALQKARGNLSDYKTASVESKKSTDALADSTLSNLVGKLDALSDRLKTDEDQISSLVLSSYPEKSSSGMDLAQSERRTLKPIKGDLTLGDTSDDVVELRYILGAYAASASGNKDVLPINPPTDEAKLRVMDEDLVAAVKRFQRREGFTGKAIDGEVGPNTGKKLNGFVDRCNADPDGCWVGLAPTTAQTQAGAKAAQGGNQPSQDNKRSIVPDIQRIGAALDGLKRLVAERNIDLKETGEFTAQLAKIAALWSKRTLLYFSDLCAALRFAPSLAARLLPEIRRIPVAGRLGARPVAE